MLYCLFENGAIAEGPCSLPRAWRHVSGLDLMPDADLATLGWLPVTVQEAEFEPLTQKLGEAEISIDADVVSFALPAVALDPAEAIANLKAYAARKRFEIETGGLLVGGIDVATDRESQALINGAYAAMQLDPGRLIKWKGINGFVEVDAAAMTAIAEAVASHVQACFAAEAEIVAAISAGTISSKAEIDAAGWPA